LTRHQLLSSIHKALHGSLRRNNVGEGSALSPCGWLDRDGGLKVGFGRLFVLGLNLLRLHGFLGGVLGLLGGSFLHNRLLDGHGGWGRWSQQGGGVASRHGTIRGGLRAGGGGRGRIGKTTRAAFLLTAAQHLVVDLFHLEGLGIPVARRRKRRKVGFSHGWCFLGRLLGSGSGTIVRGSLFVGHVLAISSFGCVAPALLVVLRFGSGGGVGVDTAAAVASSLIVRPLLSGIVASSVFGIELRRVHGR